MAYRRAAMAARFKGALMTLAACAVSVALAGCAAEDGPLSGLHGASSQPSPEAYMANTFFVNSAGNLENMNGDVIDFETEGAKAVGRYAEGRILVKWEEGGVAHYGFIDSDGRVVFDIAKSMSRIVDTEDGMQVLSYGSGPMFSEGRAIVDMTYGKVGSKKRFLACLDVDGAVIWSTEEPSAPQPKTYPCYHDGYAMVDDERIVDMAGKEVLSKGSLPKPTSKKAESLSGQGFYYVGAGYVLYGGVVYDVRGKEDVEFQKFLSQSIDDYLLSIETSSEGSGLLKSREDVADMGAKPVFMDGTAELACDGGFVYAAFGNGTDLVSEDMYSLAGDTLVGDESLPYISRSAHTAAQPHGGLIAAFLYQAREDGKTIDFDAGAEFGVYDQHDEVVATQQDIFGEDSPRFDFSGSDGAPLEDLRVTWLDTGRWIFEDMRPASRATMLVVFQDGRFVCSIPCGSAASDLSTSLYRSE